MTNRRSNQSQSTFYVWMLAALVALAAPTGLASANGGGFFLPEADDLALPTGIILMGLVPIALTTVSTVAYLRNHPTASSLAVFELLSGAAAVGGGAFLVTENHPAGYFPLLSGLVALGHATYGLATNRSPEPEPVDFSISVAPAAGFVSFDGTF